MDPSSGNIRPSWAVTNAPVIRNVRNATIQYGNMAGPANCTPAELLMNRTMATKMTIRSNGPSVLATRTGARCSETMARSCCRVACIPHPSLPWGAASGGPSGTPRTPSDRREFCSRPAAMSSRPGAGSGRYPVEAPGVLSEDPPTQAFRLRHGEEVTFHRVAEHPLQGPPAHHRRDPDDLRLGGLVGGVQQLAGGRDPEEHREHLLDAAGRPREHDRQVEIHVRQRRGDVSSDVDPREPRVDQHDG